MNRIFELTKRNVTLFLRDRAAIFFSFLSSIIIVALYFLFVANLYKDGLGQMMGVDSVDAQNFVIYTQMMAGVLILNSMSLSLGAFQTVARDFGDNRTSIFLMTPLRTPELLCSYMLSGMFVSFTLNLLTWVVSVVLIGILTGYWITVSTFFMAVLVILIASIISAAIMIFLVAIVRSPTAIGVISGISGTFFGFLCGIYIPFSTLGDGVVKVGSFIPFTHLTIWFKQMVLGDAFNQLGIPSSAGDVLLKEGFSASNVGLCGIDLPLTVMVAFSAAFGVACFVAAWILMRSRLRKR